MEKKSIGAFIAILRKVNGMTQRDLADKLGVSDKTVSHWELDESAPDLTLIPVIAEIFGVTCDELLRGERINDISEEPSGKTGKQVKILLGKLQNSFKIRSMVSLGLSATGLLTTLFFNFSYSSTYLGFLISGIFYMTAVICESIFYSYAFYAVSGNDFSAIELNDYKMYVVHLTGKIISASVIMLTVSLPLVVLPDVGSEAARLVLGLFAGVIAAVVCMFTVYIVNSALIKKGVYSLTKSADIKRHKVNRLKVMCISITAAILFALFLGQLFFGSVVGLEAFTAGTTFDNCDDFKAYMENGDAKRGLQDYYGPRPTGEAMDYGVDENGDPISEEQALADYIQTVTGYIYDNDGNIVCQYVCLNPEVSFVKYSGVGTDKLSITAYTYEQRYNGESARNLINLAWVGSYFIAAGAGFLVYFKKRVWLG